jgi:Fe-S-cluster containining protein
MIGQLHEILNDMKSGVYDFTDNGECSRCGSCCSALLPVSRKELKEIERYVKKHKIRPQNHAYGAPVTEKPLDLTCPFRDDQKKICMIYKVRPEICREFKCDKPHKEIEISRNLISKRLFVVDLRRLFE